MQDYDYNSAGCYFITICTLKKEKLLCDIVGTAVPGGPQVQFTPYGEVARKHLENMSGFYQDIKIEKYAVMPNHVHLLIRILEKLDEASGNGPPRTSVPTQKPKIPSSRISNFIGTFKRFCNREYGRNIWQPRSYDHIIRGEADYLEIWEYIDQNPAKWNEDRFYIR